MRCLPMFTMALALLLAPTPGRAGEEAPDAPEPKEAPPSTKLPFELEASPDGLLFQVTTSAASRPRPEDATRGEPGDKILPEPRSGGHTYEYGLTVTQSDDKGAVVTVSVRSLPTRATPVEEGTGDDDAPRMGSEQRVFDVRVSTEGEIQEPEAETLPPNDKKRLQLILGSGLHGKSLENGHIYVVGGVALWLDEGANESDEDGVVFSILAREDDALEPGATSDAPMGTPTDRAVYDVEDGLLETLQLSEGAGQGEGSQRIEIRRLPVVPPSEDQAG